MSLGKSEQSCTESRMVSCHHYSSQTARRGSDLRNADFQLWLPSCRPYSARCVGCALSSPRRSEDRLAWDHATVILPLSGCAHFVDSSRRVIEPVAWNAASRSNQHKCPASAYTLSCAISLGFVTSPPWSAGRTARKFPPTHQRCTMPQMSNPAQHRDSE